MSKKPVVLLIRDGWGINPGGKANAKQNGDATLLARTPFHDQLYATYPVCKVSASGEDVGLPEGQMGNSEVGHLNLGAGRIVYQDLTRINKAIRDGELVKNAVLQEAFSKAKGLGFQIPSETGLSVPMWQRAIYKIVGIGAIFLGIWAVRAEWFGGRSTPPFAAAKAQPKIRALHEARRLEEASALASDAILESPMAHVLYLQKGAIELNFEGTQNEVDGYFAAERAISPDWPQVPLLQGNCWLPFDPTRTAALYKDAVDRAHRIDRAQGTGWSRALTMFEIVLQQSEIYPELQRKLFNVATQNPEMTLLWLRQVQPAVAAEKIPVLSQDVAFLNVLQLDSKKAFARVWYEKGNRDTLFTFAKQHPDWQEAIWPMTVRRLIDAREFQSALELVSKKYQVDLLLPEPGGKKRLTMHEESDDPLVNFDFYWQTGNEITARRIIAEAAVKADATHRTAPEIWRKNAALSVRAGQWEPAWRHLQRYLQETGRPLSF